MKKIIKIFLFIGVFLLVGGFFAFKKITDTSLPKNVIGSYTCEMPGFVERKIMFRNTNLKSAYFSTQKDTLHLKEDFSLEHISYNSKDIRTILHGNWNIHNDSLILFYSEDSLEKKFTSLKFFNELYNLGEMTFCRDTLIKAPLITNFKKIN